MDDLTVAGELAADLVRQQVDVGAGVGESVDLCCLPLLVRQGAVDSVERLETQVDVVGHGDVNLHVVQVQTHTNDAQWSSPGFSSGFDAVGLWLSCRR